MAKISQTVNGQVPQTAIISKIKRRLATNAFFKGKFAKFYFL